MNLSSLRERAEKLAIANAHIIGNLPEKMVGTLPPLLRTVAKGILPAIPQNFTDVVIHKIRTVPDAELEKTWTYLSKMYEYLAAGVYTGDESQRNISSTLPPDDDPGHERQRENGISDLSTQSVSGQNAD